MTMLKHGSGWAVRFNDSKALPELLQHYECYIDALRAAKVVVPLICAEAFSAGSEYRFWESYAANARGDEPIGKIVKVEVTP